MGTHFASRGVDLLARVGELAHDEQGVGAEQIRLGVVVPLLEERGVVGEQHGESAIGVVAPEVGPGPFVLSIEPEVGAALHLGVVEDRLRVVAGGVVSARDVEVRAVGEPLVAAGPLPCGLRREEGGHRVFGFALE